MEYFYSHQTIAQELVSPGQIFTFKGFLSFQIDKEAKTKLKTSNAGAFSSK